MEEVLRQIDAIIWALHPDEKTCMQDKATARDVVMDTLDSLDNDQFYAVIEKLTRDV